MKKENRWPVGLAVILSSFAGILVVYVVLAHFNKMDLVSTDYYEQGIKYQQQIDRINRGSQRSHSVRLEYDRSNRLLSIQFPETLQAELISGTLVLFRPSDARQDRNLPLVPDINCRQVIDLKNFSNGLWRIKIFWQVNALEFYHEEKLVIE